MRVRLGFAVAAHLEPEILLVDEVLAVGDAAFQKKCLGKMDEASKGGRTVIFVSHNMAAVESLCGHCLLLEEGHIRAMGSAEGIVQEHLASMTDRTSVPLHERKDRTGNGALRFTGLRLLDERGKEIPGLRTGSLARIEASYDQFECSSDGNRLVISLGIQTYFSQSLLLCRNDYTGDELASAPGSHRVVCEIPRFPLLPGRYLINVYAEERGEILDWVRSAMNLEVSDGDFFGTGLLPPKGYGAVLVGHRWLREN